MTRDNHSSAANQVYRALRKAIVDLTYRPGAALSRPELARAFGTSPTPVREALLRLQREGFVIVRPQAGTEVAPIKVTALHQAQFLRRSLEESIVRRLASRSEPLEPVGDLSPEAVADPSLDADDRFHTVLFQAAGMGALRVEIAPVLATLDRFRTFVSLHNEGDSQSSKDHADILDRIIARDADGAARAMAAHLSFELQSLAKQLKNHPAMFS